jgi:hypothetical protein
MPKRTPESSQAAARRRRAIRRVEGLSPDELLAMVESEVERRERVRLSRRSYAERLELVVESDEATFGTAAPIELGRRAQALTGELMARVERALETGHLRDFAAARRFFGELPAPVRRYAFAWCFVEQEGFEGADREIEEFTEAAGRIRARRRRARG